MKREAKKKRRSLNAEIIQVLETEAVEADRRRQLIHLRKELDRFAASLSPLDDSVPLIRGDREAIADGGDICPGLLGGRERYASGEVLLIAPDIFLAEFANLVAKRTRRKQISAEQAHEAFSLMKRCAPRLLETRPRLSRAGWLCSTNGPCGVVFISWSSWNTNVRFLPRTAGFSAPGGRVILPCGWCNNGSRLFTRAGVDEIESRLGPVSATPLFHVGSRSYGVPDR
jgi:hypothetical protein